MQTKYLREYDIVRVKRLNLSTRPFDGTQSAMRPPRVGDVGTIVHEYVPGDATAPVLVEMVDEDGSTLWLADFAREELEFVERPNWAEE